MQKGLTLSHLERYEEAIQCFDKVLEQDPERDDVLYSRGVCHHHLGAHEDAVRDFDQVLEQGPPSIYSLAALHFKAKSLATLGRAGAVQSCTVTEQAYQALGEDRFADAAALFRKALEADQFYAPALRNWAILLSELGRFEQALELYGRALSLEGQNTNAWYGRGVCLARLNRLPEAVQAFRRAVELAPNDAEAWKDLGTCLVQQQKYQEALEAWQKAAQLDPRIDLRENIRQLQTWTEGQLHWPSMLAYAHFREGHLREAAAYFDASLAIDPRQDVLWNDRGLCAEHLEGPKRAIECFDRVLVIDPENAHAWYNRGVSLSNLGKFAESVAAFEKVLAIHRAKQLAPDENLLHGHHNLGASLWRLGKLEEAVDHFDEVLRLAREDPRSDVARISATLASITGAVCTNGIGRLLSTSGRRTQGESHVWARM